MDLPRPASHVPNLPLDGAEAAARAPRPRGALLLLVAMAFGFAAEIAHSLLVVPGRGLPSLVAMVELGGGMRHLVFDEGEAFRLLTLAFLHGGFLHAAMNGFCLYALGQRLEPRMGSAAFLALFAVGSVGASLVSMLWIEPRIVAVGASGGILALAGFLGVFAWRQPAYRGRKGDLDLARGLVLATLLIGFTAGLAIGIDNAAHLGGLATGAVLGVLVPGRGGKARVPALLVLAINLAAAATRLDGVARLSGLF